MKKIILVLLLAVSACNYDSYNSLYYENIKVKNMYDYDFGYDIEVTNIDEAIKYVWGIKEYWQIPEETLELKK